MTLEPQTVTVILGELQALRAEQAELRSGFTTAIQATSGTYQKLLDIEKQLLGNGQPGLIQKLETEQRYILQTLKKHQALFDHSSGWRGAMALIAHYTVTVLIAFGSGLLAKFSK